MEERFERYRPDLDFYHRRARDGPCFVRAGEFGYSPIAEGRVARLDELAGGVALGAAREAKRASSN